MERIFTLDEIAGVAREFWQEAGGGRVFAFHGELGAGKTTFIKALCEVKGVKDVVSSPTFSLINEYVFSDESGKNQVIYHLDLYRIHDEEEASRAGIEDCLYSRAICLVEWPGKVPGLLPADTQHVYLTPEGDKRKLTRKNN